MITNFKCSYLQGKYEFIDCLKAKNPPNGITAKAVTHSGHTAHFGNYLKLNKTIVKHLVRTFELVWIE